MNRFVFSLLIIACFSQAAFGLPDTSHVKNWYNTNYVTDLTRSGARLAIGSTKGIILFTPQDSTFVILNRADGLLENQVNAISANDTDIFICVPTGITVLASDTSRIRNISTSFTGLQGEAQAIFVKDDTVFLGTTDYLYVWDTEGNPYNPFNLSWTNTAYSLRGYGIRSLLAIQDTLYVGTDGGGLCMIPNSLFPDTTQWVWNTMGDGLPNDTVTAMVRWSGELWIGTRDGIVAGSLGSWTGQNTGLVSRAINRLMSSDTLWAATGDSPHYWNGGASQWMSITQGLSGNRRITGVEEDLSGRLWIGIEKDGIAEYTTLWQRHRIPGPSSNNFSDIAIDADGSIWGVHYGGFVQEGRWYTISHFNGTTWEIMNDPNDLGVEGPFRWVDIDDDNRKWFGIWQLGTDIDIVTYSEAAQWDSLPLPIFGVVGAQFIDSNDNKWFSNYGNSVCKLHPDNVTWETFTDQNYFNYIVAFAEDSKGNIYFGSYQRGVSVMSPQGSVTRIPGLPSDQVYDIFVDARDDVWIGATSAGVTVVRDMVVVENYTSGNSGLLGDIINDILIDWQGNKYFLVENHGVSILKHTGEWDSITVSMGLASDLILDDLDGLTFDVPEGYLWIATKDGITRYDTELEPPASDPTLQAVDVFPNPFVASRHTRVTFGQLPEGAEVYIYSLSLMEIRVIDDIEPQTHRAFWYGTDEQDKPVDSGIYLFVILHPNGNKKIGKIAVVR